MSREIKFRAWNQRFKTMDFGGGDLLLRINDDFSDPMQYTGLQDKNGVHIYEGDILRGYKCEYPITFNNGSFMWGDEFLGWDAFGDYEASVSIEKDDCKALEVIGNIHQNKNLIKE